MSNLDFDLHYNLPSQQQQQQLNPLIKTNVENVELNKLEEKPTEDYTDIGGLDK